MRSIQKNTVAVINYTLKTIDGKWVDQGEQVPYIHGHQNFLSGMVEALEGIKVDEEISKALGPGEGGASASLLELKAKLGLAEKNPSSEDTPPPPTE